MQLGCRLEQELTLAITYLRLLRPQASDDPVGMALALQSTYGKTWWQHSWQKNDIATKIFPTPTADEQPAKDLAKA